MAGPIKEQIEGIDFLPAVIADVEQQFLRASYQPVMDAQIAELEAAHQSYFSAEESPTGEKWPALSPVTIATKGHDRILYEFGDLLASLTGQSPDAVREVSDQGLTFGTQDPKSFHHQHGDGVPRRQHVGVDNETLDAMVTRVADHAVESLKIKV